MTGVERVGGVVSFLEQQIDKEKKRQQKYVVGGLRRPRTNENHTTTNQKHVDVTKEVKERSCDRRGEGGGSVNRLFGGNQVG